MKLNFKIKVEKWIFLIIVRLKYVLLDVNLKLGVIIVFGIICIYLSDILFF